MEIDRKTRGIPLLTAGQCLILVAVVCATVLIWPRRDAEVDSTILKDGVVERRLDNLRMAEASAASGLEGVPDLLNSLTDPERLTRRNALLALRRIGSDASAALAEVQERFSDDDSEVRSLAIEAYWHIRRDPNDVASAVTPMLGDTVEDVRNTASRVLRRIGPSAIPSIVELLKSGPASNRVPAIRVLRRIGWDATEQEIDRVLRSPARDADEQLEALWTLVAWGNPAPSEIRELLEQSVPMDQWPVGMGPGPRETALRAIARLGPAAENVMAVLELFSRSEVGRQERMLALEALRAMKANARPATPRLLQVARVSVDDLWIDIGWVLFEIGAEPQEILEIAMPFLTERNLENCFHAGRLCAVVDPVEARRNVKQLLPRLSSEQTSESLATLSAIWGLAPEAQDAIPTLTRMLESRLPNAARTAAKTLRDLAPEANSALPTLVTQLAGGSETHLPYTRQAFCEAIGAMGPVARSAIPVLMKELQDASLARVSSNRVGEGHQPVVADAISALVHIGASDVAVIQAIRRHLHNDDESVQILALDALSELIPESPEVLDCHLNWLRANSASQNRNNVMLVLSRFPGNRNDAVELLIEALYSEGLDNRKSAAWSLGQFGPDARSALPTLREVLGRWEDSHYPDRKWRALPRSRSPREQLDHDRWFGRKAHLKSDEIRLKLHDKSVHDVVRDAIKQIEAKSP